MNSCERCTAIRREYLALASALAQDVSSDPLTEIPLRLQHSLHSTQELVSLFNGSTEKEDRWKNVISNFDAPEFDETRYHEVRILRGGQRLLGEDQHQQYS